MQSAGFLATAACRLRDLKNGLYQIHFYDGKAYEGNLAQISVQATRRGVDDQDLVTAILEMEETGDTYAEFGILGRFLYTASDKKAAG